ncbi:MAG: hypothetical protein QT02_C0005G0017 [archaeon GW2011_AR9]|nr:MAG: hypothetical protein QT02_C0005G0017 [archaeon GW2011_AR9]MBS3120635.1 hypothetical protein [Candidatus Woesearchaeota archaeon]HIG93690.1 hypothetical protein [Candidatus Woesearchaeota archaeon]HIH13029.1 hypothetical protein [Candidatus Woesearchaeota archaeon]
MKVTLKPVKCLAAQLREEFRDVLYQGNSRAGIRCEYWDIQAGERVIEGTPLRVSQTSLYLAPGDAPSLSRPLRLSLLAITDYQRVEKPEIYQYRLF